MVSVLDVLEQGQLPCFYGVLWDRSAYNHITMPPFPLVGLVPKLAHFPAILEPGEPATLGLDGDGIALSGFGYDHISRFCCKTPLVKAPPHSRSLSSVRVLASYRLV